MAANVHSDPALTSMTMMRSACIAAAAALALAGCGNTDSKQSAGPAAPKGIFVSASDCATSGKLTIEQCGKAIDVALIEHEKAAKTYATLQQCGKKEGENYCDKAVDGTYRGRILAFLVTMSPKHPTAEPLFAGTTSKAVGFRSPTQPLVNAQDDSLIVSNLALGVAHDNVADKLKKTRKKD